MAFCSLTDSRRCCSPFVVMVLMCGICAAAGAAHARPAASKKGMVASAHPLATKAGVLMLRRGGNAIDAAVATSLVLGVVEPYSSGIGGGGFMLLYLAAAKRVIALDFRERAPLRATKMMFAPGIKQGKAPSRFGGLSVAVPGQVAGLYEAHRRWGKLPWRTVVAPAIRLARRGFPVTPRLITAISSRAPHFNAAATRIFLPRGKVPELGQRLVQRDLARTLMSIARRGVAAFYRGRIASAIVREVNRSDGIFSLADLAGYRVKFRAPIAGTYRGYRVFSMPPPSSGGAHLVQMLNVLELFEISKLGFNSAATIHLLAETMKHAYRDRAKYLGDPDFVRVPLSGLLSKSYGREIARWVEWDRRKPLPELKGRKGPVRYEHPSTSHLSVVDSAGNAVSLTQTINLWFGSCLVAAGTGVVLNDEMDDFAVLPGLPNAFGLIGGAANAVAPGKRPLSSMTPTIVLHGERPAIVAGSPGGSRIITTVLQVLLNVIDFGMTIDRAVSAPRVHFQWVPDVLFYEKNGLALDVQRRLRALGHILRQAGPMGNAQAIRFDAKSGILWGGSDARGEGLAEGP